MKRLSRWVWMSSLALFVGSLPHAVGATFEYNTQQVVKTKDEYCLIILPSLQEMKKLAKAQGKVIALQEFDSHKEWYALYELWMRESKWDYRADNPKSSAYGIPQILNMPKDTRMIDQIQLGIKYIKHRYGTPSNALAFHNENGWY